MDIDNKPYEEVLYSWSLGNIVPIIISIEKDSRMENKYTTSIIKESAFTTTYERIVDRLINNVDVVIDNQKHTCRAMWDTGANISCITKKFANSLNLKSSETVGVKGAVGKDMRPVYVVDIILPGCIRIPNVKLVETDFFDMEFDIVIGMNVIQDGDFCVNNYEGSTSFSFRKPSTSQINFTENC